MVIITCIYTTDVSYGLLERYDTSTHVDVGHGASLGWFRRWRILVILSVKCSRNRSAMTSSEQWCSGGVRGSLRPIRAFATMYMDFVFRVDSSILSQKYADFLVISSRMYPATR